MKTLKDYYLEKKKNLLNVVHIPSKDRNSESQERLDKYIRLIPRLRKLKEAEYFREEFMEPQIDEARVNA